jgi:hypothetical protein
MSSGNVVIAGGSGMIGGHLVRSLVADGYGVTVLTRDPARTARRLPAGVRAVGWAVRPDAALVSALDGAAAVVNLSGVPIGPLPWTPGRRRAILDSRVRSATALVDAMAQLPPDRRPRALLNASGTDLYTGLDAEPATEETSQPVTGFLADVCRAWEAAALPAEALGVRVALMRTGFVLARDSQIVGLLALPFRLFVGGPLGDGRQWMSWIHVDDVVGIYRLAVEDASLTGPVNVVGPDPRPEADVAAAIGRALGRPSRLRVPAVLIRTLMGEQSTLVLGSRRAVPARAAAAGYRFRHPELGAAVADVLR